MAACEALPFAAALSAPSLSNMYQQRGQGRSEMYCRRPRSLILDHKQQRLQCSGTWALPAAARASAPMLGSGWPPPSAARRRTPRGPRPPCCATGWAAGPCSCRSRLRHCCHWPRPLPRLPARPLPAAPPPLTGQPALWAGCGPRTQAASDSASLASSAWATWACAGINGRWLETPLGAPRPPAALGPRRASAAGAPARAWPSQNF